MFFKLRRGLGNVAVSFKSAFLQGVQGEFNIGRIVFHHQQPQWDRDLERIGGALGSFRFLREF
jgi:hypothetical protein